MFDLLKALNFITYYFIYYSLLILFIISCVYSEINNFQNIPYIIYIT